MGVLQKIDIIKAALAEKPRSSALDLAKETGLTRQRVYQLCKEHGIKLVDKRFTRPVGAQWTNHFGGAEKLTSHFIGGASELTACADLLRRGVPVYRALTFVSAAALVMDLGGRLLRVEVKSAKRTQKGTLTYQSPYYPDRYDILALVEPDGSVTYKPNPFTVEMSLSG